MKVLGWVEEHNPFMAWWPVPVRRITMIAKRRLAETMAGMIREGFLDWIQMGLDIIQEVAGAIGAEVKVVNLEKLMEEQKWLR